MTKLLLKFILSKISEDTIEAIQKDLVRLDIPYGGLYGKLCENTPFRNIFFYRIEREMEGKTKLFYLIYRILKKRFLPIVSVEIYSEEEIGGGLYIPHNHCVIVCKSMGENVTVRQGVTIGKGVDGKKPVLGNNIEIFPNAVIAGGIVIGDNSYIGANALVLQSIDSSSTVKGIKGKISHYANGDKS